MLPVLLCAPTATCVAAAVMSLFQNSEYKPLPAEEKHEHEAETPQISAKEGRGKKFYIALATLIAIALLPFIGFGFARTTSETSDASAPSLHDAEPMDEKSKEFLSGLARAGDQQYLLGVGKADITGSVLARPNI